MVCGRTSGKTSPLRWLATDTGQVLALASGVVVQFEPGQTPGLNPKTHHSTGHSRPDIDEGQTDGRHAEQRSGDPAQSECRHGDRIADHIR